MSRQSLKLTPLSLTYVGLALVAVAVVGTVAVQRLSSRAGTALQSGVVGNAAPSVDAVVPSDASGSGSVALPAAGFTLNEGATRDLYVRGTVSDPNGCEDISGVSVTAYRPGVAYGGTDGMDAAGVLGQADFTHGTANYEGSVTAKGMYGPAGSVVDPVGRHLFISEASNHRVLVFDLNADGIPVDATADYVLGQADFSGNIVNRGNASPSSNTLSRPRGLYWDAPNSRLFVVDQGNNRLVTYDLAGGISDGMAASHFVGQADFGQGSANRGSASPSSQSMRSPLGVAMDVTGSRLFIGDQLNNRVLIYDLSAGLSDDMVAANVLGQAIFSTATAGVTRNGMSRPTGVAWDGVSARLFVVDNPNNRVVAYNLSTGVANGMDQAWVLGQSDFTSGSANRGQTVAANTMNSPIYASFENAASRLFVSDTSNNRVIAFDVSAGITNGMAASHVMGQSGMAANLANQGGSTGANTFSSPGGTTWDSVHNRLFVDDISNNRVLWYDLDAGSACAPDANNCYTASIAKAALAGCTGAGDTDATFEASIPVANFADPTDAGSPYDFQAWRADAVVTDAATLAGSLSSDFEVQSLAAFSVTPSLMDYGTIALGATSTQQALTFTNTGNRAVNSNVRADGAMHSSLAGFADIASAQTHYSVSQAAAWSAGTAVAATDSDLPLALQQQQTDGGPAPTAPAYFYLKLPASGIRGTYTNTLFFTAYAR